LYHKGRVNFEERTTMELRHLETLVAIAEEGSFTAAADVLATVQSNVSEQVRQLEAELGVPLLVRGRRGAEPTEFGALVLERARRIERELDALRADIALVQGLETGHARLGVVGTASRWLVPSLVGELRSQAPGVRLRVNEGASERLFAEVIEGELAQAVVTEPVSDRRLEVEHLLAEAILGIVGAGVDLPPDPVPLAAFAKLPLALPPEPNPLRMELEALAASQGVTLAVPVEVEGIRLLADLVATGGFASILPETAIPPELRHVRIVRIAKMPPRRLAIVRARDAQLSMADQAVRDAVKRLVSSRAYGPDPTPPAKAVRSRRSR
jgi:DNA-binding transcriptional LysR family regulator